MKNVVNLNKTKDASTDLLESMLAAIVLEMCERSTKVVNFRLERDDKEGANHYQTRYEKYNAIYHRLQHIPGRIKWKEDQYEEG